MTQLEDCYFCGTVEDTLESSPVIPPETSPPEAAQRTVVLCPTCREKLGRVLDPVVEYLDNQTADEERGGGDETGGVSDESPVADAPTRQTGADDTEQRADAERGEQGEDDEPAGEGEPGSEDRAGDLPDGTRKIVRLLRNREFPVDRAEIVPVAANAYGIGREQSHAAIDALLERGWLIERDGELHRTE